MSLAGCSSPRKDISQKVSKGMDKDAVLQILGNPSRSKHVNGADRWSYDEYINGDKQVTHIYFKKGKVTFVGRDDELIKELKNLEEKKPDNSGKFREL